FASIDAPVRTLLVTSSNPGEGKTTTAANLAFAMAMDGKRVILVDTDLRRPSMHKLLSLPTMPGLTDVLLDHATLAETLLEHEDMPNLVALMSGSTPPNPGELLNSRKFRNLVQELSAQADIVIFDSPPVLVAADAAILASQMDGTILVVETGETKKGAARQTLRTLQQARANLLGIAYNKMRIMDGSGYFYYQYQYKTPAMTDSAPANGRKRLSANGAETNTENAESANHWHAADQDDSKQ
ncbi:MAG: CpsD/CapB family tyrosine-protein kinase, partial [Armatimonadota bacterium]|nr:CpsD/CapB family tyrosine-protein kinase [Armatimonadota bacterium]